MNVEKVKYVIWARDMNRALDFYKNVFNCSINKRSEVISEVEIAGVTIGIHGGGEGGETWTGITFQIADVIKGASKEEDIKVDNSSFLKAIWTVLLADFTMSLDNVLGVAGAAGHHYHLLIFGLILSIILMAVAANLISGWIKKYKWIAWVGLLAILIVAVELIYTDIKTLIL